MHAGGASEVSGASDANLASQRSSTGGAAVKPSTAGAWPTFLAMSKGHITFISLSPVAASHAVGHIGGARACAPSRVTPEIAAAYSSVMG